jgi:hypothetical protein
LPAGHASRAGFINSDTRLIFIHFLSSAQFYRGSAIARPGREPALKCCRPMEAANLFAPPGRQLGPIDTWPAIRTAIRFQGEPP